MKKLKLFILLVTLTLPSLLHGHIQLPLELQTPPKGTSNIEMIEFLKEIVAHSDLFEMEISTVSHEKREIPILFHPQKSQWKKDNSTIMLFAQQHGDEPSGKEALLMLIHRLYHNPKSNDYAALNLILIPMVNPDGDEVYKRKNNRNIDLNRNHVILTEPETQMLHRVFEKYRPEVTLDIHEYGMRSWLKEGYIKDFGEQLDCMSNLTIPNILKKFALTEILEPTLIVTHSYGVKANRYLVCKSSTKQFVRHSTTDIDDGRNSFGIRYTLSFILEGLGGLTKEDRIWERAKHQLTLIENFLKICNEKSREISKLVKEIRNKFEEQIPDSIIIQADYTKNFSKTLNAGLKRTSDLKDTTILLPDYRPQPQAIVVVKRPDAYIIEKPSPQVIDIMKYQQIEYRFLTSIETFSVEKFLISGRDTLNYEGRKTVIPAGSFLRIEKTFQPGDMMVPVNNIRANQIVQILEPQSFYGLSHYEEFQFLLKENVYPIYRLVN